MLELKIILLNNWVSTLGKTNGEQKNIVANNCYNIIRQDSIHHLRCLAILFILLKQRKTRLPREICLIISDNVLSPT